MKVSAQSGSSARLMGELAPAVHRCESTGVPVGTVAAGGFLHVRNVRPPKRGVINSAIYGFPFRLDGNT